MKGKKITLFRHKLMLCKRLSEQGCEGTADEKQEYVHEAASSEALGERADSGGLVMSQTRLLMREAYQHRLNTNDNR